ncbi:unnamed protein product [Bursaphelenchus xylophilus]|uniref:(pine wood nematode) hypothetical protein n=1 Tax=Bursaphelenchus xylophilus TaxID=6326 RepID=A0A1I7S421_BURXY|nr:unnamed protein product [Bursaphelenchus xylophilus]CAG9116638.1 unnamed protein product [Bursaphelenchus xylophilus]
MLENATAELVGDYGYLRQAIDPLISNTQAVMGRDSMSYLLPDYRTVTPCTIGTSSSCAVAQIPNSSLYLSSGNTYQMMDKFIRILQDANAYSIQRSEFLIFTNINCSNVRNDNMYPDVYDMFVTNFEKTLNTIKSSNLHTYIFWNRLETMSGPCKNLKDYKDTKLVYISQTNWNMTGFKEEVKQKFVEEWDATGSGGALSPEEEEGGYAAVIGGSVGGFVFLALTALGIYLYRKRKREQKLREFAESHKHSSKKDTVNIKTDDRYEIDNKDLTFDYDIILGSGVSGKVYKGSLDRFNVETREFTKVEVAIKIAHVVAKQAVKNDMLREISLMKCLSNHPHILQLVGCISDPSNPVLATEYCANGDLLHVLREHALHFWDPEPCRRVKICLLMADIYKIAEQIASAMGYIASKKYVHRDLAARNVFITAEMEIKVGDFGLCRQYQEDFYTQQAGKLPIKYMALESLKDFSFSERTDVWSYGVLFFEILSGGEKPYSDIQNEDMVYYLENGRRLQLPEQTPAELSDLIHRCWLVDPLERPTFEELTKKMREFQGLSPISDDVIAMENETEEDEEEKERDE